MQSKTYSIKKSEVKEAWHVIDAKGEVLGRLATRVSRLLLGKDKPTFSSHINVGDKVVVINAGRIEVTGRKLVNKMYYRHSGYPGGLKEESLGSMMDKSPEDVLKIAVKGMLPVNKLRAVRLKNLYVYKGEEHPHKGQVKG